MRPECCPRIFPLRARGRSGNALLAAATRASGSLVVETRCLRERLSRKVKRNYAQRGSQKIKAYMNSSLRQHAIPAVFLAWIFVPHLFGQVIPAPTQGSKATGQANRTIPAQSPGPQELPKRIFWIIPNYRSHPSFNAAKPLSTGAKFKLAALDSFDPGTFLTAGALAGIGQASNSTKSYGQGIAGYGRYYGSAYGNIMIGNFMTEAIFPSVFKQDPRYFRRGTGSTWSRLGYAMGQIFITHGDNRRTQFNFSEFLGNSTAVAISTAYVPDNRTAADAARQLGTQLGIDMAGNILKEFAPDLHRRTSGKKHARSYSGSSSSK
jgi:hypothetical protein